MRERERDWKEEFYEWEIIINNLTRFESSLRNLEFLRLCRHKRKKNILTRARDKMKRDYDHVDMLSELKRIYIYF